MSIAREREEKREYFGRDYNMDLSLSICYNSAKRGGFTPPKRRAKEEKAKEKEKLAKTIRLIGWGFVLIFLNFNIGTLNLVPSWLGYLLFVSALSDLKKESSAPRLKDFAWLLVGLDFFYWVLECFGLKEAAAFFYVIPAAVSIYFDFKFFTFLAEIAGRNCCPEEEKLLVLRSANVAMAAAALVITPLLGLGLGRALFMAYALAALILVPYTLYVLFSFAKSLEKE